MKKIIVLIVGIIVLIGIAGVIWYNVSTSSIGEEDEKVDIVVSLGSTTNDIAIILEQNNLIRNKLAFRIYVKLNNVANFQAGSYSLNRGMNMKELTETLKTGIMYSEDQIRVTFIEGKGIEWLANEIEKVTDNKKEDVLALLENEEYLDRLIEKYWFITEDVKNKGLYYSLEGYLFPETYFIANRGTSIEEIFEKMLNQTEKVLQDYKEDIQNSKYTVHELLTMASIIERESMGSEGRKDVASVIYNRLKKNMAIQSDVTTYYAFRVDMGERDLYQSEIDKYNGYNTRGPNMEGKLPIGPISSVGRTSIEAAVYPNDTDYLFFVADKNGKLYFSRDNNEHNRIISDLKSNGLWFIY